MTAKIILTSEPGSAKFADRVLLFDQEEVRVSRSITEEKPDTYNAVFDCRVLSKSQAVFTFYDGKFYLRDLGSSNGTFINNFRLREGKEGEETQIYSQDIVRFGSQIEIGKYRGKAKCIVASMRIYLSDGTEYSERPANDKFFRSKAELFRQENTKQVRFLDPELSIEEKVDNLEKIITQKFGSEQDILSDTIDNLEKKLKRKENENHNLLENITKIYGAELHQIAEKYDSKDSLESQREGCEKLADELSVKVKEHIQNLKVKNLENELEETRKTLKCTTEESWLLKEKLRSEEEESKIKDEEISKLSNSIHDIEEYKSQKPEEDNVTHVQMKILFKDGWEKVESQNVEVKQLNNLLKEGEITELTSLVEKEIKIKDRDYVNLKSLVTEENKFADKINIEMTRLLNIIAEDQETILKKDQAIYELEISMREKDENLENKKRINDSKRDEYYEEYNLILREEISNMAAKNATKVDNLVIEIEILKNIIFEKKDEIQGMKFSLEKQKEIFATCESLKASLKESEWIIEQKNKEVEKFKNLAKDKLDIDYKMYEMKKENSELKVSIWQKDSDIATLNVMIKKKDNIIAKNYAQIDQYMEQVHQLKVKNVEEKKEFENNIVEKENIIIDLEEIKKKNQIEIDRARGELDNLKNETVKYPNSKEGDNLKTKIIQEKQTLDNLQYTEEKEIEDEEKGSSHKNTISSHQESEILFEESELELDELGKHSVQDLGMLTESPPSRPPRTKFKSKTAYKKEQANNPIQQDHDDDDSDTVSFHDALNNDLSVTFSDEEDVVIEDLELDEETDDRQHRKSDINIDDFY